MREKINKLKELLVLLFDWFIYLLWIIIFILFWCYVWYLIMIWSVDDTKADYKPKITYNNLFIKWFIKPPFKLYSRLKNECFKQKARNKEHCIKVWLSIAYAESSWKDLSTWYGLQSEKKDTQQWVKQYKLYWWKWKEWGRFYWYSSNKPAETRYCMSEKSSWSIWYCKNWRKNFNKIFFNLHFYNKLINKYGKSRNKFRN
jgi:hypothetical protein